MDRRTFLKAGFAGFLAAINPFKTPAQDPEVQKRVESVVANGFVAEEYRETDIVSDYLAQKGVLVWGDKPEGTPGCLFQDMALSVTVWKNTPRCDVKGMFTKVIGPRPIMTAAYDQFGDVMKAQENVLKVGLPKGDGSTVWFKIQKVVLTSIGVSVVAKTFEPGVPNAQHDVIQPRFEGDDGQLMISEFLHFQAYGEPELCDKPITLDLALKQGMKIDVDASQREVTRRSMFSLGTNVVTRKD